MNKAKRINSGAASVLLFSLLAFVASSCTEKRRTHENLNSVLWVQTSAEYRILFEHIYADAKEKLGAALEDPNWTAAVEQIGNYSDLPPAVIMDLDETVLENSPFVAQLIKEDRSYGADLWTAWVSKSQSKPLPGALEFVEYVRGKGVEVFFVTNRDHETEPATRRNLRSLGLQLTARTDTVLTRNERPDWGQDKASRRRFVAERFRILLLFGNELEDFVSTGQSTPEARVRLMGKYGAFWGKRWFLFPNPVYGPWERALYGYDAGLSKEEKIRRKYERLETPK